MYQEVAAGPGQLTFWGLLEMNSSATGTKALALSNRYCSGAEGRETRRAGHFQYPSKSSGRFKPLIHLLFMPFPSPDKFLRSL